MPPSPARLCVLLGDQLDDASPLLSRGPDAGTVLWLAEVRAESTHVWSSKVRTTLFLSAMRHFRDRLRQRGWTVIYRQLDEADNQGSLGAELARTLAQLRPRQVALVQPGDFRVLRELEATCQAAQVPLQIHPDPHFLCPREVFHAHVGGRKQLRMEFFYREMRRREKVLLTPEGEPEGGAWNFDEENRASFGREGPGAVPPPRRFLPDALTREVIALVEAQFPGHPGQLETFDWPVSAEEAELALADFIAHRLPLFGRYQDALWQGEPWLYHSRLAAAMNLKLLSPRRVIQAAEAAYRQGQVPLAAAEGFIRQILGWREYVRGIYWEFMPEYAEKNALQATEALPPFYWTGEVPMACLRDALGQTLRHGYAHHIQRLMVTGLYSLLLGVRPQAVHEWYLAVYVDAVEWVELPNTLGMSQYADGGLLASKPYIASGKYLQRMSNHCAHCPYDPARATGSGACPFTTLYWDFILRHDALLRGNPRLGMQVRNADRLSPAERSRIQEQAQRLRASGGIPPTVPSDTLF